MDSLAQIVVAVITSSGLTFGGYWTYLQKTKDRRENREATKEDQRIVDLKEYHARERESWDRERQDLRRKLEQANDVLSRNTTALEASNENDVILAGLVEQAMKKLAAIQEGR